MEFNEVQDHKKSDENLAREPLGLTETKKNAAPKRPRNREVTSRFMSSTVSSSSGTRCLSPDFHSKRPQPIPRKPTPYPMESKINILEGPKRPAGEALRSLTVSMHAEKFNLDQPTAVTKPGNTTGEPPSRMEATAEKKRLVMSLFKEGSEYQSENAKPVENILPKPKTGKSHVHPMSRSVNINNEKFSRPPQARARSTKPNTVNKSVYGHIGDDVLASNTSRMVPLDGRGRGTALKGPEGNTIKTTEEPTEIRPSTAQELKQADTDGDTGAGDMPSSPESMSSDCTSQTLNATRRSQECTSHGFFVPARFLQDTNSRSRGSAEVRYSMPETDLSTSTSVRVRGTGNLGAGKLSKSTNQGLPPPLPGSQPTVSPVKIIPGSPSRCLPSPTKARKQAMLPPTANSQNVRNSLAGSVVNFCADTRKGKKGANHIEDAHIFRLLYNRHLQWRFVNAKAESAMNVQKAAAEKMLHNMWMATSELQDSVTMKRIEQQKAFQENKLRSVLSGQEAYLEDWTLLEQDHISVLSEAIKNLEAATLRLPITNGVKANVQEVKEALDSAVNMMDSVSSSVSSLLPKVESTSTLVCELAAVTAQEKAILDECGDLIATMGMLQVEESSLRTHLIQLKQDKCRGSR
ncbi:hypothetical protein SUGI_0097600 [Cryptomeria japonica]|uniref:QWRF motif-containing protein 2 n=1 Tax=Cryptomeria japonica TaxID=3369 RepID=UPI002408B3BE|nr:QWRF motif-containing protein 2 [Cryptomeria japonica]XP_057840540.2 QWRF motif-containing protein 2 [Cryptomeria japonica]XP_057840541.2 QWRF motif-containing protein 2 [Cryptomeria japonica]GLJ08886.1 hypothetical protein SUGI_0097600 [Cryptomeria japonica]